MFQISPSFKNATRFENGITKPQCIAPDPIGLWTTQYNFHFPPALSVHDDDDTQYIREAVRCRLIHDVPRPYTSLYLMLSQYNPWLDCEMTREKRTFLKPRAGEMCYPVYCASNGFGGGGGCGGGSGGCGGGGGGGGSDSVNDFFHNETVVDIINLYLWPLLYSRADSVIACKTFGDWRRLFASTISLAFPEYNYWNSLASGINTGGILTGSFVSVADQRRTAHLMKYMKPARVLYLITTRANLWPYGPSSSTSTRSWRQYGLCSIKPKMKEYTDKTEIDWLVGADFLRKMKRVHIYFTNNASFSDSSGCCIIDWDSNE
jgi:hypothetical protein